MKKYMLILLSLISCLFFGCKSSSNYTLNILGESTVLEGEQIKLEIETNLNNYIASWYSANELIATINEYGVVTGISEGTCKILLNLGNKTAITDVIVKKNNIQIEGEKTLLVGETTTLNVKYDSEKEKKVFFSSENNDVATVDSFGTIKAISKGKTCIVVNVSGLEKKFDIVVKNNNEENNPKPITPLEVSVPEFIKFDELVIVSANREVIWTSSNENILYVNENNEIIIIDMGVVTLRATDKNNQYSYVDTIITVSSGIAPTSIVIYSENNIYDVRIGQNYLPLYVKTLFEEKEVDLRVSWSVDNIDIATVDDRGVLTPKKVGKVVVKATSLLDSSVQATITINVIK